MRSVFLFSLFLSISPLLEASVQEGPSEVPEVTYTHIKEAGFLKKRWGVLNLEGEIWHFHWHLDQEKRIETLFPPDRFFYKVFCVDALRLKESNTCDSRFAAFEICPVPRLKNEEDRQEGLLSAILYTFYLAKPAFCHISHG